MAARAVAGPLDGGVRRHDADDPIVAEVHEIRRQLLERHGGFEGTIDFSPKPMAVRDYVRE